MNFEIKGKKHVPAIERFLKKRIENGLAKRIVLAFFCSILTMGVVFAGVGVEVHAFQLQNSSNTHGLLALESASPTQVSAIANGTNGQVMIAATGADPAFATVLGGTGIGFATGANSLTINNTGVTSITAGNGISVNVTTGAVTVSATTGGGVVAKTSNYTVVTTDSGTLFTNAGASAEVDFTLPTSAPTSSLSHVYSFMLMAAQKVKVVMPASTTLLDADVQTTAAGDAYTSTLYYVITIREVDSTHYAVMNATGTWTTE